MSKLIIEEPLEFLCGPVYFTILFVVLEAVLEHGREVAVPVTHTLVLGFLDVLLNSKDINWVINYVQVLLI